jgi:hypothetical protein
MASDYGLAFGFRRSDESVRVSEGRLKTPATGPVLLQGTAVEIDPVNAGYLRVAGAGVHKRPGTTGLLIQEEAWDRNILTESNWVDSYGLMFTKPNRLSVVTSGAGTKVWMKNIPAKTRGDGRVMNAVTMFLSAGVAVGRGLAWNGTAFIDVADPLDATSFGEVTYFDGSRGYVEFVLAN